MASDDFRWIAFAQVHIAHLGVQDCANVRRMFKGRLVFASATSRSWTDASGAVASSTGLIVGMADILLWTNFLEELAA